MNNIWAITPDGLRQWRERMTGWKAGPTPNPTGHSPQPTASGLSVADMMPLARDDPQAAVQLRGAVAVIPVRGVVMKDAPGWAVKAGWAADTRLLREQALIVAAAPDVESVLLVIDSPGGSVDGLAELGDALYALRQAKRLVAAVDGLAASAAYYIASQADQIVAGRMDLIGSIGTIIVAYDVSRMFDEAGIETVVISTGRLKGTGVTGSELTDDQRAYLQEVVDQFFGDFRAAVGRGRPALQGPAFDAVASGRVWTAADAQRLKLIDALGSPDEVLGRMQAELREAGRGRMARAKARAVDVGPS